MLPHLVTNLRRSVRGSKTDQGGSRTDQGATRQGATRQGDGRADRGFFPAPFLGAAFFAVRAICCFLWMKDFKPGEVQVRAYSASVGKRW